MAQVLGRSRSQEESEVAGRVSKSTIRAAGGVLWRTAPGSGPGEPNFQIAVIHRPRYDDWSFPKGKLSPGESEVEGAIREVLEETGYRVRLGRAIGEVRYEKLTNWGSRPKVVRYWSMHADGGSFSPNKEADDLRWLRLADARAVLTHERDREILDQFVRGPLVTRIVLLVRHASAGSRSAWDGDDRLRPLDEKGRLQAEGLVRILSRFEVGDIVSADFVRCVETVQPLADSVGVAIKQDPLLSESGYPNHEEDAAELLRGLGGPEVAAVASTQGDVIPDVLRRLATGGSVHLPDVVEYKKGSTWALSFDDGRLIAADYMAPPAL